MMASASLAPASGLSGFGNLSVVVVEHRGEAYWQIPFEVISEHVQERLGADGLLQFIRGRPNAQADFLQATICGRALALGHDCGGRSNARRLKRGYRGGCDRRHVTIVEQRHLLESAGNQSLQRGDPIELNGTQVVLVDGRLLDHTAIASTTRSRAK
jgi:hypothetical protein